MEPSKHFSCSRPTCPKSDPANPHKLFRRYDPPLSICFACKGHRLKKKRYYYYCTTCDLEFHRGCHIFPPEIKHPFHLLHSLTLTSSNPDYDSSNICVDWKSVSSDSEDYDIDEHVDEVSLSDTNHVKCKSCWRNLEEIYYHCSICNFSLHIYCAMNSPPLTIENLKSHDHTLTLFPRRILAPCDACGFSLDATFDRVYSCILCNYMVHKKCIYLPRVIKITRHPHRLSHTSSIVPSVELSCGVCREPVDVNYGQYSCNKRCHYAVHSKCATKKEVWDGIDLEEVPEEEEEEDIEPFMKIDGELIQHFSHNHHYLKLYGNGNHHENKFCQACILPITILDGFYSCVQCSFVLHEECASLPRQKCHPIHKHPLTLFHPFSLNIYERKLEYAKKGYLRCSGCSRMCCGFIYKCCDKDCDFVLDARCASLPDPSTHGLHQHDHPLFFNLTEGECMGCKHSCSKKFLECIKCKSFLGLKCATWPSVAHYKHDKHPLTLCYGEEKIVDLQYWCEICETKLDATKWFYTCNSCSVTLHLRCLLGKEIYMKPNHIIKIEDKGVYIVSNIGNSRPLCDGCGQRCSDTLVTKWLDKSFCSLYCFGKLRREE